MSYQSKAKRAMDLVKRKRSTTLQTNQYIPARSSQIDREFLTIHAPLSKTGAEEVGAYIQKLREQKKKTMV
ncbi:hypothetical protein [Paenibacillus hunanensis]|uniref:Uncharacterized protein n=1 Tax=Paenibacillus hunanensis TaxID=539262 RepID=A0ABU1IXZ9_9BACL|nr:hypothetical protein [Paenibacillus hunanensis]MCL9660572.1 hypothetical protein [Paenibacillus hunanensis]MDR6244135.1 hypothetical protein [Paenibacillus hunanensis]GGJ19254.1 hypothetical protein GCM10008022_30520 [Paenibacillus hunanensis]